jgi:magnesium chelatase subunit D
MSTQSSIPSPWDDAVFVAALFAVDPVGLGGVSVRARTGPVRDRWMEVLRDFLPLAAPVRRVPGGISDSRLLGGLDLTATLQAGRPIAERGVLAETDGGIVILPMAERLEPGITGRLAAVLDAGELHVERDGLALRIQSRFGVIALDEGADDSECAPPALLDRLAFHLALDQIALGDAAEESMLAETVAAARARLSSTEVAGPVLQALCGTAAALGIASIRPSLLAVRAARGIAALAGRTKVSQEDAARAARLVLAPRATMMPMPEPDQSSESPPPDQPDSTKPNQSEAETDNAHEPDEGESHGKLEDLVLAAAQAAIPAGLLNRLRVTGQGRARNGTAGKSGGLQQTNRRGRPAGVRNARPRSGSRLNLIETLRAAAPWQRLRKGAALQDDESGRRIAVRPEDFRVTRLKQRSETITIFVVDASGSSALNRLAEAKGAVELLLGECYSRRDKVALIAFRGRGADLLLPPTRSLVRAKRCLANLPGGGGTPLASGIDAAAALAEGIRRQGATPVMILMTDGQANIARGGIAGRSQAQADASAAASLVRAASLTALLIDTSPRAHPAAGRLAADMGATYLPLPAANAASLSQSVRTAIQQSQTERAAA